MNTGACTKEKKTGIEIISFNHQSNVVFLKFISLSAELSLEHIQNHFKKNKAVLKPQVLSGFASVGKMAIKYIRLSMLVITYFFYFSSTGTKDSIYVV